MGTVVADNPVILDRSKVWNGRDDSEPVVAAAVYFALQITHDRIDSKGMVLLKRGNINLTRRPWKYTRAFKLQDKRLR